MAKRIDETVVKTGDTVIVDVPGVNIQCFVEILPKDSPSFDFRGQSTWGRIWGFDSRDILYCPKCGNKLTHSTNDGKNYCFFC